MDGRFAVLLFPFVGHASFLGVLKRHRTLNKVGYFHVKILERPRIEYAMLVLYEIL
jgi:hypothetical protein